MSTDLHTLAENLRSQLLDLGVEASATATTGSDSLSVQLSADAAQKLSGLLDSYAKQPAPGGQESPADQEWEATSERVSEIEGFTGGDASD